MSYQAENACINESEISFQTLVSLVGQKFRLDFGPQELGLDTRDLRDK